MCDIDHYNHLVSSNFVKIDTFIKDSKNNFIVLNFNTSICGLIIDLIKCCIVSLHF